LDLGKCPLITVSGLLANAIYCKNVQNIRIKSHAVESIGTFFEEQIAVLWPNVKIDWS
jgi:hypothetical protein